MGKGLLYYAIAAIVSWVSYLIYGWSYKHAPAVYHFVLFLFLLGGLAWTIYYAALFLAGSRTKINYGILIIHLIILLTVSASLIMMIYSSDETDIKTTNPKDAITIIKNDTAKQIILKDGNGDTVYLQKKDSVYLNKFSGKN